MTVTPEQLAITRWRRLRSRTPLTCPPRSSGEAGRAHLAPMAAYASSGRHTPPQTSKAEAVKVLAAAAT